MTSMNITHANANWLGRPVAKLYRAMERVVLRRQLRALLNMPDYLLKDIGLQRHEIMAEGFKRIFEK